MTDHIEYSLEYIIEYVIHTKPKALHKHSGWKHI